MKQDEKSQAGFGIPTFVRMVVGIFAQRKSQPPLCHYRALPDNPGISHEQVRIKII